MSTGTQLRDESLSRIASLATAMKENINGEVVISTLYPEFDPNTVLRDITVANSLVRILTATFTTLVEASTNVALDSVRESQSEDHDSGGGSGGE